MMQASHLSVRAAPDQETCTLSSLTDLRVEMISAGGDMAAAQLKMREWRLLIGGVNNALAAAAIGGFWTTVEITQMERGMADNDAPSAHAVRVSTTTDGRPLVEFLDEKGAPFACAEFEQLVFAHFIGECCDLLEIAAKGGLATCPCAGVA